jgi:hypothetical protein
VAEAVVLIAPPSAAAVLPDRVELTTVSAPLLITAPPSPLELLPLSVRPIMLRLWPELTLNTRLVPPLTVTLFEPALMVRFLLMTISPLVSAIVSGEANVMVAPSQALVIT